MVDDDENVRYRLYVANRFPYFSAVNSRDSELESRSSALTELLSTNEELARSKVVLEMRCLELEEQRDRSKVEEKEMKEAMASLKKELEVTQCITLQIIVT